MVRVDASTAGAIGAGAGALAGLSGVLLSSWQQYLSEARRWKWSRIDAIWVSEREALLEFTTLMAASYQAIAWLSWSAGVKSPEDLKREIEVYDQVMREGLPRIFRAQVAATGLDESAYRAISELTRQLIETDTEIGTKCARYTAGDVSSENILQELRGYHDRALALQADLALKMRHYLHRA